MPQVCLGDASQQACVLGGAAPATAKPAQPCVIRPGRVGRRRWRLGQRARSFGGGVCFGTGGTRGACTDTDLARLSSRGAVAAGRGRAATQCRRVSAASCLRRRSGCWGAQWRRRSGQRRWWRTGEGRSWRGHSRRTRSGALCACRRSTAVVRQQAAAAPKSAASHAAAASGVCGACQPRGRRGAAGSGGGSGGHAGDHAGGKRAACHAAQAEHPAAPSAACDARRRWPAEQAAAYAALQRHRCTGCARRRWGLGRGGFGQGARVANKEGARVANREGEGVRAVGAACERGGQEM
eukprot:132735-Chlamydomonas_euryale.AAC.1